MSATTAAIIGAAIGAGGAVTAQITTAIAAARRERSRLEWEKECQDREWKAHEKERWMAEKQQLYSTYGTAVHELLSFINAKIVKTNSAALEPPKQPDLEALNRINANIELMAPEEVATPALRCASQLMMMVYWINAKYNMPTDQLKELADTVTRNWWDVHYAMRSDLHGAKSRFKLAATYIQRS